MAFKEIFHSIQKHDVVLIHKESKPWMFARIEDIVSGGTNPAGNWWEVSFTGFSAPLQKFKWTLDDNHIQEAPFSLDGIQYCLEVIPTDQPASREQEAVVEVVKKIAGRKVVALKPEFEKYCPDHPDFGK